MTQLKKDAQRVVYTTAQRAEIAKSYDECIITLEEGMKEVREHYKKSKPQPK